MFNQNTPEWLEMRKNKIGASDAPPIMGTSKYKSAFKLWQEKLDLVPMDTITPAMQRGHDLEDRARQELERLTDHFLLPQVKFHKSIEYMMASLDAIDPEGKYAAEIKCPNKQDHEIAKSGNVPDKYYPQLQHQLEVCELDCIDYFSFDGQEGVIVKVFRNDQYIKKLLQKEFVFWECMQNFIAPELTEKDYEVYSDEQWKVLAQEFLKVQESLKAYDDLVKKAKELENQIISMANHRNCMGEGIKVTHYFRKGNVDYSKIPELKDINLDGYRKKPTECYRITSM